MKISRENATFVWFVPPIKRSPLFSSLFLAVTLVLHIFSANAQAQMRASITIGIPKQEFSENIMSKDEVIGRITLAALARPLVGISSEHGQIVLKLADAMQVSPDGKRWSFRVRPTALFADGSQVRASDVEFSLRRCQEQTKGRWISSITSIRDGADSIARNESVQVTLHDTAGGNATTKGEKDSSAWVAFVAQCPIVKEAAVQQFGSFWGKDAANIASGFYQIADIRTHREVTLDLVSSSVAPRGALKEITVKAFDSSDAGLSALRSGSFDFIVGADPKIVATALHDETLAVLQCEQDSIVYRKSLHLELPCSGGFDVSEVRFSL